MKILAIHDGHNAAACYLENGRVVSMVSEERFSNVKNQGGFPSQSLAWIMRTNSLSMGEVDKIVFPSLVYTNTYESGYGASRRHRVLYLLSELVPPGIRKSNLIIKPYTSFFGLLRKAQTRRYAKQYHFDVSKVLFVEHHEAHGYAALCTSGFQRQGKPVLIFTLDDSGDGVSSRVALWERGKGYQITQQSSSPHSICNLFSNVTKHLGMKPGEHEYKLMGMAPYAKLECAAEVANALKRHFYVNRVGQIVNRSYYGPRMLSVIRKKLAYKRFDNICAGMQMMLEDVVLSWIQHWTNLISADRVVFGGGGFMNVKLNQAISSALRRRVIFFCPSCGDESLAMGAGIAIAERVNERTNESFSSIYLGPSHNDNELEKAFVKYGDTLKWERLEKPDDEMARMIVEGKLIGRVRGKAEWGARALGNRSILCRADDISVVGRLNKAVKKRDFWMPFAPSIIFEDASNYIRFAVDVRSDFMQLAFNTTELGQRHIAAALHPYDLTCRPQLVRRDSNAEFYDLLVKVKQLSGLSGVLNTSYNLHGYPIAEAIDTCLNTYQNSRLDALFIESFKICRR